MFLRQRGPLSAPPLPTEKGCTHEERSYRDISFLLSVLLPNRNTECAQREHTAMLAIHGWQERQEQGSSTLLLNKKLHHLVIVTT